MPEAPNIPPNLSELVCEKFETAKLSGDINFWPTKVAVVPVNGFPVSIMLYACKVLH